MQITTDEVRDALRKDDFDYINNQITRYIAAAKASLYAVLGEKAGGDYFLVKPEYVAEFESLTDSYIIEYCRAFMDQVDNDRILTIIATQLEAFIVPKPPEAPDHG